MARRVESLYSTVLFVLVFFTTVHGTRDILPETCVDQYGANLNGNGRIILVYTIASAVI